MPCSTHRASRRSDDMRGVVRSGDSQIADAGRPGASPAPTRSRAPACAAGTCRAPRACRQRHCRATAACCRPDELRQKFEAAGIDLDKPVVTSCGSGITAADHHAGAGDARPSGTTGSTTVRGPSGAADRHAGGDRPDMNERQRTPGSHSGDGDVPGDDQAAGQLCASADEPADRADEDARHAAAFLPLPDGPGGAEMALGQRAAPERRGACGQDPCTGARHQGALSRRLAGRLLRHQAASSRTRPRSPISA